MKPIAVAGISASDDEEPVRAAEQQADRQPERQRRPDREHLVRAGLHPPAGLFDGAAGRRGGLGQARGDGARPIGDLVRDVAGRRRDVAATVERRSCESSAHLAAYVV